MNFYTLFQFRIGSCMTKTSLLTMKIIVLLVFIAVFQVNAKSHAQKVSLSEKNSTLQKVFSVIKKQTGYNFVYDGNVIKAAKPVNIEVKNAQLIDVLDLCFREQPFLYEILNNTIIVKKKTSEAAGLGKSEGRSLGQQKVVGKVIDEKGNPIDGATISIKGGTAGVSTDKDGHFTLSVPSNAVLLVSYLGFITEQVAYKGEQSITVILKEDLQALGEVVVTALGIKRDVRSLGYSTTSVNTDQLAESRTNNVGNSLQGKVAGLNVSAPASGPGGSSKIRIRGQSSFGGDNSPLIIVNGVPINSGVLSSGEGTGSAISDSGDGLQSINSDDIESMTVLKGAAAAALYGFRAKDGAIIITTRSGSRSTGIGIDFSSSFQASEALDYTDFQYEYGMGEYGKRPQNVFEARQFGTFSFGEKLDGVETMQVDGQMHPYSAHKNRVSDFFNLGTSFTNSLSVSGGNEVGNFRLSYTNTDANSIVPNSDFKRNILNLGLNYDFTAKLSLQLNANYSNEHNRNPAVIGQQELNINSTLYTMANSLDINLLENNYKTAYGDELTISRFLTRTNPYWATNERFENSKRDRLFGNVSLRYQFTPWLYAQARAGQDYFTRPYEYNRPTGTGYLAAAPVGYNGNYFSSINTFRERNLDFLIGVNQQFGHFKVDATVGGNALEQTQTSIGTSVTNFYVRDLYTIGNGVNKSPEQGYSKKKVNSLYGSVNLSYEDFLYFTVTGRNDWFSTLNPESNNYLYPSVSTSYVFTDHFSDSKLFSSWLNFGKLRVAYAEVGGDTDPYANNLFYNIGSNPFNGVGLGSISGTVAPNSNLKPLKIKETEIGLELRALNNRVNLDVAVYRKNTVDEILDVSVSNASGYSSTKVNVGSLRNQGIEGLLTVFPIQKENMSWETGFNASYNISKVISLAEGQSILYKDSSNDFIGRVAHEVGQPLGSLRWFDYKRDDQGRIVTTNGLFQQGNEMTFGSAIPTWTGGWLNTIRFKNIRLFTQIDFKAGHQIISSSNFNMMRHGLHKASLVGREGGVTFPGVNADGTPNSTAVEAEVFYSQYRTANVGTPFVYDASFIRFRTLSLGYDITSFFKNTPLKSVNLNAFVNNLFLIKKSVDNIDPETEYSTSDNASGLENHALPTTRTYGLHLQIKF